MSNKNKRRRLGKGDEKLKGGSEVSKEMAVWELLVCDPVCNTNTTRS